MFMFIDRNRYLFIAAGNLKEINCDFSEITKMMRCSSLWYSAVIVLHVLGLVHMRVRSSHCEVAASIASEAGQPSG